MPLASAAMTHRRSDSVVVSTALAAFLRVTPEATRSRACSFCSGLNRFPLSGVFLLRLDFFFELAGMMSGPSEKPLVKGLFVPCSAPSLFPLASHSQPFTLGAQAGSRVVRP